MPETPDFDQIAERTFLDLPNGSVRDRTAFIAEQLRLIWNARGAADLVKIEASLTSQMGATASGPYLKNLDRALRTLDR